MRFSLAPETLQRLDHRMQFVLGPEFDASFPHWSRIEAASGLRLTSHPDLSVTRVEHRGVTLTLLGYLLDPFAPTATDEEILISLAAQLAYGAELFGSLETLGGRYLLLVDAGEPLIVGDASGTMQLFHAAVGGERWCAAQPHHLARLLRLREDPEARDFIDWVKSETHEHSWPLDSSPYSGVRRLLPNHFLDLNTFDAVRYWPRAPYVEGDVESLLPKVAEGLKQLVTAGASRFELSMGISAGLDSRVMLAASREVAQKIVYYTAQSPERGASHPDVAIPTTMLADLGVRHDLIVRGDGPSEEFAGVFRDSVPDAHQHRVAGLQTQLDYYRLGRVAVLGNISEVARLIYRTSKRVPPLVGRPTAEYLSRLPAMAHPFALRHCQRWLDGLGDTMGYHVLDLFFWEHRHGSWFAHNCGEFTFGWRDVFLPYNCRALIVDLLAVPVAQRTGRAVGLYERIAHELWPEVLAYPINPVSRVEKWRRKLWLALSGVKRTLAPNLRPRLHPRLRPKLRP
ncbi:MAG TPA: hypothetical protein VFD39_06750 [Trueperaceae bacterium]|nr:hypothetical protein [Trueperaceae bacterium]